MAPLKVIVSSKQRTTLAEGWSRREQHARECGMAAREAMATGINPEYPSAINLILPKPQYWVVVRTGRGRPLRNAIFSPCLSAIQDTISGPLAIYRAFASLREARIFCLAAGAQITR